MKLIKEIRNKTGELHFKRWSIFSSKLFSIYIHGIYKADEEKHLHDHPWSFISIVLKGSYTEQLKERVEQYHGVYTYSGHTGTTLNYKFDRVERTVIDYRFTKRKPLSIAIRKAKSFHKIFSLHSPVIYTLVFVGKKKREWGYDVDGQWINNIKYRTIKNENNNFK